MIPLFTSKQIREIDNYAINNLSIPSFALMENAAISIYNEIENHFPSEQTFGILVGKGNNGGDGLSLARHLINNGKFVNLIFVDDPKNLKGDSLINWKILSNYDTTLLEYKVYKSKKDINSIKNADIIIDALLGTGSKGKLKAAYSEIVNSVNQFDCYRIAVDIPTGLDCDTGFGEVIYDADLTVTLAEYKRGLFFEKGYQYSGKIQRGSIGINNTFFDKFAVQDYLIEPEDSFENLPVKELDAHKYNSGKVLVIGASFDLPGASLLAGISALKSGAGAVILAVPYKASLIMNNTYPDIVVHKVGNSEQTHFTNKSLSELSERINWANSIVLGPGLGREKETKEFVLSLLKKYSQKRFIIDADALFLIADKLEDLNLVNSVLTPHHGEFERLSGIKKEKFQEDILSAGKKFAVKNKCILVLKGSRTIIFNQSEEAFINTSGNPGMAKFGSGDSLSGLLGSFLAQLKDFESAIISAVYLHSLSADILLEEKTEFGITASDICNNIPNAIRFLRNSVD